MQPHIWHYLKMRNMRDLAKLFKGYGESRARRVRNNIPGSQRDGGSLFAED